MIKRLFDIVFAFLGLLILLPLFLVIGVAVMVDSRGGIFYSQKRVGKRGIDFELYKFRTMKPNSDKKGLLTIGEKDDRVTKVGYYLRKYKLDELPQLWNVLKGDMSLVGPRPEVPKYVDLYNPIHVQVLSVRPGVTDPASLKFLDESELLAQQDDPEQFYRDTLLPEKLKINLEYAKGHSLGKDLKIIFQTLAKIAGR